MLPNLVVVRTLVLALAAALAPTARPAADVDVSIVGLVTDAQTGAPIGGAHLMIEARSMGALSNRTGRYMLQLGNSWTGREVEVVARAVGYAQASGTLIVGQGANALDFALMPVAPESERREGRAGYERGTETGFVSARTSPLSTFAIDVDRGSYSNVRRFISDGVRPPIDAVRIEQLLNAFPFSDPTPEGDEPFSVTTEVAPAPWQPLHHLVRIGLKGRPIDMRDVPGNNLVFLIDVSGSMDSPDELPLLKTAFGTLVDHLRPQDRVAIVVHAGADGLVLPSTPGSEKSEILGALERLRVGGSTADGAGIRLAYAVAAENHIDGGNNRLILATDGGFEAGASSDAELIGLIEEQRAQGTFLTVLGFGRGTPRLAKMARMAEHGNGKLVHVSGPLEAQRALVAEIGGTLVTIAQDVEIHVELNPARVAAYRLIGYENRPVAADDFADAREDAGEVGAGHSVTALYEVVPVGVDSPVEVQEIDAIRRATASIASTDGNPELMLVNVRYQEPGSSERRLLSRAVDGVTDRPSDDFRFAAAVASWGMLLRDSQHCRGFTLEDVSRLASGALGADEGGRRAEFLRLVDRTRSLELLAMRPGGSR